MRESKARERTEESREPSERNKLFSLLLNCVQKERTLSHTVFNDHQATAQVEQLERKLNRIMSQGDEYAAAMVEFLSCFPSISTPPSELSDLADGITMFEALSEM